MFNLADKSLIVGVYVDDIVVMGRSFKAIEALKASLTEAYPIKDMGEIGTCLGIRSTRNRVLRTLEPDQEAYLSGVLAQYNMEDCTSVSTPIDGDASLLKSTPDEPRAEQHGCMSVVGSITYSALARTRLTIWQSSLCMNSPLWKYLNRNSLTLLFHPTNNEKLIIAPAPTIS